MKIEDVPSFYQVYVRNVINGGLMESLQSSGEELYHVCKDLDESQALYRYKEDKWSIKDLVQHLTDSERVFGYRAMRFARNDQTELSGFDQNDFVDVAFADKFGMKDLVRSFQNVRQASIDLFSTFSESDLVKKGKSNGVEMSVAMIGLIISGHTLHHLNIIKQHYI